LTDTDNTKHDYEQQQHNKPKQNTQATTYGTETRPWLSDRV